MNLISSLPTMPSLYLPTLVWSHQCILSRIAAAYLHVSVGAYLATRLSLHLQILLSAQLPQSLLSSVECLLSSPHIGLRPFVARLNGPSSGGLYGPWVGRQTTNRRGPAWPLHYRTWPVYGPPT